MVVSSPLKFSHSGRKMKIRRYLSLYHLYINIFCSAYLSLCLSLFFLYHYIIHSHSVSVPLCHSVCIFDPMCPCLCFSISVCLVFFSVSVNVYSSLYLSPSLCHSVFLYYISLFLTLSLSVRKKEHRRATSPQTGY